MKKKLIASIFSLIMAFVLMTSASFAWFTVSTAPEVEKINVAVGATNNIEIARAGNNLDAPGEVKADSEFNETEFGGQITDFQTVTQLQVPATVGKSGTAVADKLATVQYDTTGRTAGLVAAVEGTTITNGVSAFTVDSTANSKKCAAVYYVWMRTNTQGDITVEATNVKVATVAKGTAAPQDSAYTAVSSTVDATATNYANKVGIAICPANGAQLTDATTSSVKAYKDFTAASKFIPLAYDNSKSAYVLGNGVKLIESCTPDTAYLMKVLVYIDGEYFHASDVDQDYYVQVGELTFKNSAITPDETNAIGAGTVTKTS